MIRLSNCDLAIDSDAVDEEGKHFVVSLSEAGDKVLEDKDLVIDKLIQTIEGLAADAEAWRQLVRCGKCKYQRDGSMLWCGRTDGMCQIQPDGFCSKGEAKDEH